MLGFFTTRGLRVVRLPTRGLRAQSMSVPVNKTEATSLIHLTTELNSATSVAYSWLIASVWSRGGGQRPHLSEGGTSKNL